jgi:glycosyltransferase involved in cell wall biosynthesis
MSKQLKVMWLGLRGFPHVQGGVEVHAEHICPILAELGCDVHVITRSPYQPKDIGDSWRGVRFHNLWSPRSKTFETIMHSLIGVLYAGLINRPDVLHIQSMGPAFWTPLARLLGLKVVMTTHGIDYERLTWGRLAKLVLQAGEFFGMRCSNARIVISKRIQQHNQEKHFADSTLIANGVTLPELPDSTNNLQQFGLQSEKYVLLVSRIVAEKRHLDLIEAFRLANLGDEWKLVIVGASDHPNAYTQSVLDAIEKTPNALCTGFQSGLALRELYAHAHVFVLPSSHEGMPIAMLEALSYGLPVIASNISANVEIELPEENYFKMGDTAALAEKIQMFINRPLSLEDRESRRVWVSQRYDWRDIARRTLAVYQTL